MTISRQIASRKFQQLSEIIFTEDDEYEFPNDSVNSLQHDEYEKLQEKLLATCITNTSEAQPNICADSIDKEEQDETTKENKPVVTKTTTSETEGITMLMGACQQGLEHDVRTILRR